MRAIASPARRLALASAALLLAVLTGCAEPGVFEHVQADHAAGAVGTASLHGERTLAQQGTGASGSQADADRRAAQQAAPQVLRRARSAWVGSVSVPMGSGERLPSIFTEPVRLNFDDAATGGKVSLRTMADRLTAVTGVPMRLKADVWGAADPATHAAPAPLRAPLPLPTLPGRPSASPDPAGTVAMPPAASREPSPMRSPCAGRGRCKAISTR